MLDAPPRDATRRALRRARDGVALDAAEAAVLLHARGDDLADLCASAARARDAAHGRVVTYSRKVFIPLTRLCRDRCHYCTFATTPQRVPAPFLEPAEVLAVARAGQRVGCKEALFTLGDRPEARWPAARGWLDERGYATTLDYLRAMAILVLEDTGLLPHLNPGVLSWEDIGRLKPVAPSLGMMLETTASRLWSEPGGPHYGSPDKEPRVRLRVLEDAGRQAVPFTTGILVGIGESALERAESLFAIRAVARRYGGIQEVIVQNFRAKPMTAMSGAAEPSIDELAATVAVARLVLGPAMHVQAPPNLAGGAYAALLAAGIDDWGGVSPVTPDHVNPERPWPAVAELAAACATQGFELRERLAVYPEWIGEPWIDPRVAPHVAALAAPDGRALPGARAQGRPWQEPDGGAVVGVAGSTGRIDLHVLVDGPRARAGLRSDAAAVYGELFAPVSSDERVTARDPQPRVSRMRRGVRVALARAERNPAGLSDSDALQLFDALPGAELDALCALADDVRRSSVGDDVTFVVNRNINFTNVCYTGCRFCAFAQRRTDADAYTLSLAEVGERAATAWARGATEVCMQGGIHPDLPGSAYFDIAAEVKRRTPAMHVHAFSPMEVVNGATRSALSVRDWLVRAREAGVDTIPGTAAEILDDDVRWVLTKGKLPAATWVEVVSTAHALGIRSTSTMMYGHVDAPHHWVAHLKLLARLQRETGGFTEFVPLPFVHHNSPIYLAGVARPGPTVQENRAVHAMARLLLHGTIDNIQCSWVKLGAAGSATMLRGGANDLGGTLMEETISRMAGSPHGSARTPDELAEIARSVGRPARQRTTTYGAVTSERLAIQAAAAAATAAAEHSTLPLV
ncbi:MAG: bifunctional FO biosynthesis protein CofGH [Frankia sp.]|nr:bifunctional FO biosynthesis protein CofGH [Frankia sp.]